MTQVTIKGGEFALDRLLSKDFVFTIPAYQRPYSWETAQAEELAEDLLLAMSGATPAGLEEAQPYFLGSVVLIKDDHRPEAEVVDGQQRLTTLTILLAAIRAHLQGQLAQSLTTFLYDEQNLIAGTPNRYRLRLRDRDEVFFRQYIQDPGGLQKLETINVAALTDSERHIVENPKLLLTRIGSLPEEQRFLLARYILRRCYLVVVSTPSFGSAYRIFSVLNDRGLDLSHADILKAEVIGALPEAERKIYNRRWEDVEEALGRNAFKELFSHIRTIKRKTKLEKTVLEEIREHLKPAQNPKGFVEDVLEPLARAFDIVQQANYVSTGESAKINELLKWLQRIDHSDWIPPALLILSRWNAEPPALLAHLRKLDRLASILMIGRVGINNRLKRYAAVIAAIEEKKDPLAPGSALDPNEEEKRLALAVLGGDLYLQTKVRSYVLLRLDSALSGGEASYKFDTVTVEHVLPQQPKEESVWLKWWPDEEIRAASTHCLGNLLLLSRRKNSQAQNFDFDEKKAKYFATPAGVSAFAMTTQVLAEKKWTPAVVQKRQTEMLGVLRKLWDI